MASLDEARRQLREFLADMEALKPFADPANPEAAPFVAAFAAARVRALAAATTYADAVVAT
jgi:hypothetical protein